MFFDDGWQAMECNNHVATTHKISTTQSQFTSSHPDVESTRPRSFGHVSLVPFLAGASPHEATPHLSACLRALTGRPLVARKTTSPITSLYDHSPPSHLVARLPRPATCRPPPEIPTNRPTFISWTMAPAVTPSIHPVPFCRVTGTLGLQQICIDTRD
jgi:hypothetical protein